MLTRLGKKRGDRCLRCMCSFLANHSFTLGELRLVFYLPDDASYLKLLKCAELDSFSYAEFLNGFFFRIK